MLALPGGMLNPINFLKVLREVVREGLIPGVVSIVMQGLVALSANTLLPAQMLPLES